MTNQLFRTKQIAAVALVLLFLSGCSTDAHEKAEAINAFVKECQHKGGTAHIEGSLNNLDSLIPQFLNFSCSLPPSSAAGAKK